MTHTHEMENYATADRILTGIARIAGIGIALSERRQSVGQPAEPAGRTRTRSRTVRNDFRGRACESWCEYDLISTRIIRPNVKDIVRWSSC